MTLHLKPLWIQLFQPQSWPVLSTWTLEAHIKVTLHPVAFDNESNCGVNADSTAGKMQQLHLAGICQLGRNVNLWRFCGIRICFCMRSLLIAATLPCSTSAYARLTRIGRSLIAPENTNALRAVAIAGIAHRRLSQLTRCVCI